MDKHISRRLAILLVEDEDLVRELAAEALTDQGFDVLEAPNGSTMQVLTKPFAMDILPSQISGILPS